MKKLAVLIALALSSLVPASLMAQPTGGHFASTRTVETQSWVEEWDPAQGRWVRVADDVVAQDEALPSVVTTIINGQSVTETRSAVRYAQPVPASQPAPALGQYGPFLVSSPTKATMVGSTNSHSPRDFDAMLRDFPGIATLEMVEAPGTSNDIANLAVGRKIREAGISTHVPKGGSVRSGAVELFLAGEIRTIADGATFAVHAWLDNHGREASEFAPGHPAHRLYIDYYVDMGFSEAQAKRFYAMTNSVPHASALWLKAEEMRGWIAPKLDPEHDSQLRFAARQLEADCDQCESVKAHLIETYKSIAALTSRPVVLNTVTPAIGYEDHAPLKLAHADIQANTSLLDS